MAHYWFKPKRFGFGATPSSWQGWALTAIFVAAVMGLSAWLIDDPETRIARFLFATAALTIIFVGICWRTTEGGWRWRWNKQQTTTSNSDRRER